MKTLLITFFASIFIIHTEDKTEPGQLTKDQFYRDFGSVTIIEWGNTRLFDDVTFIKDGKTITAFYDDKPELIGTTENKTFNDLPVQAQKRIQSDYKGYSVGDIILFDDNKTNETDMILYNQQFEDADNYFIELKKDNKKIIVESDRDGKISYFTRLQ